MEEEIDVSTTVEQLRSAGPDASKQLPALMKLGNWYLNKAKTIANGVDFTKANALFNAALVRSRSNVDHEISEQEILRGIVETYREFLLSFGNGVEVSVDEIRHEIDSHKQFVANERRIFKERLDKIDSSCNRTDGNDDEYKIHADKVHDLFRDIQDMYIRLVSMLIKECEGRLGPPPCDYAIIALGSVARMEATPFSDLEFAILYSDPFIGEKISYFRVLTHFLHLNVINLGETIMPCLGIEQLNDFQTSEPDGSWFYDSATPRGISFDGAMPWASKTPLGRMATKNKPALELIKTPEQMAELQDEETAVKQGYHLADIMSRATLLHGHHGLLDEYNERVAEKLNTKSSSTEGTLSRTVGFIRGIQQMMIDIVDYNPYDSYLGSHLTVGGLFHAKKEFYRLISLLLSDLGLIFDIRSPSPWQIISELHTRGIFGESESESVKVCLSIANEIRLKTYFANNKQTELLSPIPQYVNATEQSADVPIFRYFHEHILVRLLSISCDIHKRCQEFSRKYLKQDEIDASIFESPFAPSSNATQMGILYYRLQSSSKALEWLASESKDSSYYPNSLYILGVIYYGNGEFKKSAECLQQALDAHYTNEDMSSLNVVACFYSLAIVLKELRQYEMARHRLMQAISKHDEVYGERSQTLILGVIMHGLGLLDAFFGHFTSCIEVYQKVEQLYNRLGCVPDIYVLYLNLNMAQVLSELNQYEQSIEYIKRAMYLSHQVFGEHSVNSHLAQTYAIAATVYELCNFNDEALSFFKRSLELFPIMFPENANLVPDPLPCLIHMDNLESALEYAKTLYRGKPHIMLAKILYNLAWAFYSEKSLEYFREAKEIMDLILGPNHAHLITLDILNGMGTIYKDVCGDFAKAHHCFEEALSMNSVIYGEYSANDETAKIYDNIASAAEKIGNVSQAKEYYTEAVKIWEKIPITKMTCERFVLSLYSLSALCEAHGEQDEAFRYLAEAREVAKDGGCKNWKVVIILVYLYFEYIKMESFESFETSVMCCLEAREMAMNLPKNDSVPSWLIEFLHIS